MEIWVLLSLGAAFLQNLRSALQKTMTGRVSVMGASYARFLFAAPLAVGLVIVLIGPLGLPMPRPTPAFVVWSLIGGLAQIGAQLLLLTLFRLRNFAVGNTFARTETVQAVILGAILVGDRVAALPLAGIVVSLTGVVLLSATRGFGRGALNRAAGLGLACGAAFALAAVSYRAAGLSLGGEAGFLLRGAVTLAFVTLAQALVMSLYLRLRDPGAITAVVAEWRIAAPIGTVGMLASLGWFSAFTLTTAAHVKAVGQVELVFSLLTARLAFGERPSLREVAGIALVGGGILVLVLTA